jgi:GNAT superfamily N-acetyltransferase
MATAAAAADISSSSNNGKTTVTVRLATGKDVSAIAVLARELADFEKLAHICEVTDVKLLESSLWKQPAFQGPTVLMLEVAAPHSEDEEEEEQQRDQQGVVVQEAFEEVVRELNLTRPLKEDPDADSCFRSTADERRFFPYYSSFLATSGFWIDALYVREAYRGRGLGTILLKTVAKQAVRLGAGRVEWCALDWNVKAIKFYQALGAAVLPECRLCRLTGKALQSCNL